MLKADLDLKFPNPEGPGTWHVVVGKHFGSFVTHETRGFLYFYVYDKAVMIFKAG